MTRTEFSLAAGISHELAARWYHPLLVAMEACGVDSPRRQAHFLAQTGAESGGFRFTEESLNYSEKGLLIFGTRLSAEQRALLGRQPGELALPPARQAEIAESVYGGRYGNILPGDGWRFRGRGLKQITFRDNYRACGQALGLDLESEPDLLLGEMNAACSAGWYWRVNRCSDLADLDDVHGLTRLINGGYNGLQERILLTQRALRVLSPARTHLVGGAA